MKTQHTPTPWTAESINDVPMDSDQERADQEFMLRAVNSHEKLVQALKACKVLLLDDDLYSQTKELQNTINKAITKAEGKS